jgi:hypothetical protein
VGAGFSPMLSKLAGKQKCCIDLIELNHVKMTDWKTGYFIVNEDYLMNHTLPQNVGAGFSRHVRAKPALT